MSDTITLEPPVTESPEKTKPKKAKPWCVIVENDDDHTFEYVFYLFMKVFKYSKEKCFTLVEDVHNNGRAVCWSGSKEVAELKRDQIKGGGADFYANNGPVKYPLGCYIEEMP